MANYYKNEKAYFLEVPLPTNGTLTLKPGEYVNGASFARSASLGILTDKGAGPIAEITANPALLVYTEVTVGVGNTIETSELADSSVTADKIADNAITVEKILDNSITVAKLSSDAQLPTANIADNAITDIKVVPTGITRIKLDATSSGCTVTTGPDGLKITVP